MGGLVAPSMALHIFWTSYRPAPRSTSVLVSPTTDLVVKPFGRVV